MKANLPNLLALLLQDFFASHLPNLRGMSPHTIQSYRDSVVLLLRFLASHKNRPASSLDMEDLGPQEVQSFLDYLELERKNTTTTRNVRLSAVHSFFRFVAARHPDRLEHTQRILGIPFKKKQIWHIDPSTDLMDNDLIIIEDPGANGQMRPDMKRAIKASVASGRNFIFIGKAMRDLPGIFPFSVSLFEIGRASCGERG